MAYQLQPGLKIVEDKAIPNTCATEEVFLYPQPSTLNYGSSRPNTMLYGTAPYMAGKGSPAQYIETSDQLRPQSTTMFQKIIAPGRNNYLPPETKECNLPLRSQAYDASSTRCELKNGMFAQRYMNKNVNNK